MAIITLNNNSLSSVTALPAGVGNGLVKLLSITASDDTVITFDSTVITDAYDIYMMTFRDIDLGTDGTNLRMVVSGDNGSNYIETAVYKRVVMCGEHSDADDSNMIYKTGGQTQINLDGAGALAGSADKETSAGSITMYNLRKSDRGKIFHSHSTYETSGEKGRLNFGSVYLDDATVINNFKIFPATGDLNEGTFTLYGFKE